LGAIDGGEMHGKYLYRGLHIFLARENFADKIKHQRVGMLCGSRAGGV
jgi:hypothetical protein